MPTLDDLPTLAAISHTSDDLLPIYDLTASGSSKVRKISVNGLKAIPTDGVQSIAAGTIIVAKPVLLITGTGTSGITFPAASGTLRNISLINGGSGTATISGTTVITAAATSGNTSGTVASGAYATYASDGTNWYRVH
jgi:hypothetical protein